MTWDSDSTLLTRAPREGQGPSKTYPQTDGWTDGRTLPSALWPCFAEATRSIEILRKCHLRNSSTQFCYYGSPWILGATTLQKWDHFFFTHTILAGKHQTGKLKGEGTFFCQTHLENIPILPEAFLTFASKSSVGPSYAANGQEDHKTVSPIRWYWLKVVLTERWWNLKRLSFGGA